MKIASWNVNSIRARHDHVLNWLKANRPEVLCLQETKVEDGQFPKAAFEDLGYTVTIYGQKAYNGVATLTLGPVTDIISAIADLTTFEAPFNDHARVLGVTYNGVRIYSVYAPNGQEPGLPAFEFKQQWFTNFAQYLKAQHTPQDLVALGGDFNIAPLEIDVADPKRMAKACGFTPEERAWLRDWQQCLDLVDSYRKLQPEGNAYSWWDYRSKAFERGRGGMRIDQWWLTPALANKLTEVGIDTEERGKDKPSDHTVIWFEVDVPVTDTAPAKPTQNSLL